MPTLSPLPTLTHYLDKFTMPTNNWPYKTITKAAFIMLASVLIASYAHAERYQSKFFKKKINLTNNLSELKETIPKDEKMLQRFFSRNPVYTNVAVNVRVSEATLKKIFTKLEFTAKRSRRFTKIPYEVKKINNEFFDIMQKPDLKGNLEIIYNSPENRRFIYRITGTYNTFIIIRGEMIVDVRYKIRGNEVNLNALTYIVLSNKYIWESTKIFRIFPKLGKRIDGIITYNISNIVRLGQKTALDIEANP